MLRLEVREGSVRIVKHLDFILNATGGHWRVLSGPITLPDLFFKTITLIIFGEI